MRKTRIKLYPPHLDTPLSMSEARKLVSNPKSILQHAFFPFLQRNQHWTKYAEKGKTGKKKDRPIRYASRRDSYIFSHFRRLLNPLYEAELSRRGLQDCVLAYRRIPVAGKRSGKCNIHFAKDAFETIRSLGSCYAFALDIHKFFENIDHERIRQLWWRLLGSVPDRQGRQRLPDDHFKVFKAVTQCAFIDVEVAYKQLGLIGPKLTASGKRGIGYLETRKNFPLQICSPKTFRDCLSPIIDRNRDPFGIPQGSPISDILANLYMIEFDQEMNNIIRAKGGAYYRYSDDILVVLPAPIQDCLAVMSLIEDLLSKNAPRLTLKKEKTQIYHYERLCGGPDQTNKIVGSSTGTDGLEYLGFRYDGKHVYLRNSTVSGIQRKITSVANRLARQHVQTNPLMNLQQLLDSFNYSFLISKFGRVKDFDPFGKKYTSWTFWTYVEKSVAVFGELGKPITRQYGCYKSFAKKKAMAAVKRALRHR